MNFNTVVTVISALCLIKGANSIRLHKLFKYIDGFRSEHGLMGFLHVGQDYTVFLKAPTAHTKFLYYELYESRKIPYSQKFNPTLIAVSKVPVEYIKSQLMIYRTELYKAKYVNENIVPGTQVKTLKEWQLTKAVQSSGGKGIVYNNKIPLLRSVV